MDYFEETGVKGRLMYDVGETGTLDFKAKYSQISSGAINFNASLALADAAAFLNAPPFYEDPNGHDFVYINNLRPDNDQENINLALKGDWDVGFATLTGYLAYNDQDNDFVTDGTSAAFGLYGLNDVCRQSNDVRMMDTPLPAPFFYMPSNPVPEQPGQLPTVLQPDDLRRLPVPGAQPGGRS